MTKHWGAAALLLMAGIIIGAPARAQDFPTRPITMIVPFAVGGPADITGRIIADIFTRHLGQRVIVENINGAGGTIGAVRAARAAADGYTIFFGHTGTNALAPAFYPDIAYDPQKDFEPIGLTAEYPEVLVVRKDLPAKTLGEFVAYAKANPNKTTAGCPGNGTLGHITGELLGRTVGIEFGKAQYRGSAPILSDLIGSHIDIGMDSLAAYVPSILDNKIKALAIASPQRWSKLPNVPTVAESGLPGFEASVWYALLLPAKIPAEIVAKLNATTNAWLQEPKTQEFLANFGAEPAGGSPADLKAFTQAEIEKWGPIIKAANINF